MELPGPTTSILTGISDDPVSAWPPDPAELSSEHEDGFMQFYLSGHHVEITPALAASVQAHLAKVERHFEQITSIHVTLYLDNHHSDLSHRGRQNHRAEAVVRVPGGELFAEACGDDMYASIAQLSDKLDRQVQRYKGKLRQRGHVRPVFSEAMSLGQAAG